MIDGTDLFVNFGIASEKAGEAMSKLSNALNTLYKPNSITFDGDVEFEGVGTISELKNDIVSAQNSTYELTDKIDTIEDKIDQAFSRITALEANINELLEEINKLRAVSVQESEKPKQISGSEFLDGIFNDDTYSWLKGSSNII